MKVCPLCGEKDQSPVKAQRSSASDNSQRSLQTFTPQGSVFYKARGLHAYWFLEQNESPCLLQAPFGLLTLDFSSPPLVNSFPSVILAVGVYSTPVAETKYNGINEIGICFSYTKLPGVFSSCGDWIASWTQVLVC